MKVIYLDMIDACCNDNLSHNQILREKLVIGYLYSVNDDVDIDNLEVYGDDWNDVPACTNADVPYLPKDWIDKYGLKKWEIKAGGYIKDVTTLFSYNYLIENGNIKLSSELETIKNRLEFIEFTVVGIDKKLNEKRDSPKDNEKVKL